MQVNQEELNNKGSFFVTQNGSKLAEMVYTLTASGKMTINHTEVADGLRGKNTGYLLLQHAADYARAENLQIIPLCPFVKALFEKKEAEFKDVWQR